MSEAKMHEYIIERYDGLSFLPEILEYYSQSHYLNFGYWYEGTSSQLEACDNLMGKLLALLPQKSGAILDVACGKGETTAYLLKYYAPEQISAINISDVQLEIARQTAPGCNFYNMNAVEMTFKDNAFDSIISVEAAFHFYTREMFFKDALRVTKPGGHLVLSDILMSMAGEQERESRTEKNYLPDLGAYQKLLESCGYTNIQLIDVTEECWRRHFWHVVRYVHRQFLERKINRQRLQECLFHTYRRVETIEYYLLAVAQKPL
jgi:cyclopropane fatty-acyl-phospholipid synthase-like methyltransferase